MMDNIGGYPVYHRICLLVDMSNNPDRATLKESNVMKKYSVLDL